MMPSLKKLQIIPQAGPGKGKPIDVMYNPQEFSIQTRNQFQRSQLPGLRTPSTQFTGGETQTLSLSLTFDTYEKRLDVREHTSRILGLMRIKGELHSPPVCEFHWGKHLSGQRTRFLGVIDSCSQKYTLFLEDGTPVRATLDLSVSEYEDVASQLAEIKFESVDRTKARTFTSGDSLWNMAHREYGDPSLWREIALANAVDFPLDIPPGAELRVPPLE